MKSQVSPRKAYSYLRFSTPDQMRGDSFRRQTAMAQDWCLRNGYTLDDSLTFNDLGVSAFRGANSETGRLGDFLEAVKAGQVPQGSVLLVEALDRISRLTPRKAVKVLEGIIEEGITVVTVSDGRVYTEQTLDEDPISLLLAIMLFMRANEESATKARRLRAAWEAKRAKATEKPLTSVLPGWLRLNKETGKIEKVPERVKIVRRIFQMTLKGYGMEAIAYLLNQEGEKPWGRSPQASPKAMLVTTTKAEAISQGLKTYCTGTPCRYGQPTSAYLDHLAIKRGLPKAIGTNNGKEFCGRAILNWVALYRFGAAGGDRILKSKNHLEPAWMLGL